jgi:hypothetical protein
LTFQIRVDSRFRPWLIVFGVLRRNAYVRLSDTELYARFGFFSLRIEIGQIGRWEIQGPYRWWTAIGVRGTFGQPEITFGGSAHGGVALFLDRPIPRWWWVRNLSEVYFTVEDLAGLAAELERRGIPGQDVRGRAAQA